MTRTFAGVTFCDLKLIKLFAAKNLLFPAFVQMLHRTQDIHVLKVFSTMKIKLAINFFSAREKRVG